jgi:GAF domain-containing protein
MSDRTPEDNDLTGRLMEAMASLSASLLSERSLKEDLDRLLKLTCQLIPVCAGVSVGLLVEGAPTTVAESDRLALELDLVQYDEGEGPCLLALNGHTVRVGIVASDDRFPHFAVGAADRRVQSVLSLPVSYQDTVVGTINIYAREPDAFGLDDEDVATVFAAEAGALIHGSRLYDKARRSIDRLQHEHEDQTQVSRAQGVLMTLEACTAEQALGLIRNAAAANAEPIVRAAERILEAVRAVPTDAGKD